MLRRVETRQTAIELVSEHCDLAERLTLMPPSAKSRGLYFRSIDAVLHEAGVGARYRALFPESFPAIAWHPASEFLVRLAVGGALLTSPAEVHLGMFEIGRRNALAFASSLLGRTLIRFLARDPKKLMMQGAAARRQSCGYGHWELTFPSERSVVVQMTEEYMYIESYLLGAAQGTFDAIGLPVRTRVELDDRFKGRHLLEW
jgi:uncharacterized protein (TIGR02265 family)